MGSVVKAVVKPFASVAKAIMPEPPALPPPPAPVEAPPPAQETKQPEVARRRANRTTGPAVSRRETLLTGPSGVNPDMLQLGRNTLLGQ